MQSSESVKKKNKILMTNTLSKLFLGSSMNLLKSTALIVTFLSEIFLTRCVSLWLLNIWYGRILSNNWIITSVANVGYKTLIEVSISYAQQSLSVHSIAHICLNIIKCLLIEKRSYLKHFIVFLTISFFFFYKIGAQHQNVVK